MSNLIGGIPAAVRRYVDAAVAPFANIASTVSSTVNTAVTTAINNLGTSLRVDAGQTLSAGMIQTALNNLGVSYSIGAAGYFRFFGIFIIAWGSAVSSAGGGTWTYPTTFPGGVLAVFGTPVSTNANVTAAVTVSGQTSSAVNFTTLNVATGGNYAQSTFFLAIGR